MKIVDVLSAYMEMEFGSAVIACARLRALINEALDQGEWHEDFDVAVKKGELDHYECAELWDVVRRDYPESVQRLASNVMAVRSHFESALQEGMRIKWLVAEDESVVVTEGRHVARFVDGALLWVTKQLSYDGIHLASITDGEVLGEWYRPTSATDDWLPLRICFAHGALLEREAIEWTDDLSIRMDPTRSVADLAQFVMARLMSREPAETIIVSVAAEFRVHDEDRDLVLDRVKGGIIRAVTANPDNAPVAAKDPLAWASFQAVWGTLPRRHWWSRRRRPGGPWLEWCKGEGIFRTWA
jgi:hypothetical protein